MLPWCFGGRVPIRESEISVQMAKVKSKPHINLSLGLGRLGNQIFLYQIQSVQRRVGAHTNPHVCAWSQRKIRTSSFPP